MKWTNRKLSELKNSGFTLLELLIVAAIIAILAGLMISTAGFINGKVARARTESEIKSLGAALESYRSALGEYPRWTNNTVGMTSPQGGTNILVMALCPPLAIYDDGITNANSGYTNSYNPEKRVFYAFPAGMLTNVTTNYLKNITDPFGNPYYYVCPGTRNPSSYDLWSTAGNSTNTNIWIKNW